MCSSDLCIQNRIGRDVTHRERGLPQEAITPSIVEVEPEVFKQLRISKRSFHAVFGCVETCKEIRESFSIKIKIGIRIVHAQIKVSKNLGVNTNCTSPRINIFLKVCIGLIDLSVPVCRANSESPPSPAVP